jgi:hypothetical protein
VSPYQPPTPALRRVRRALERAERDGTAVTVASVARSAKVDRQFIYRDPDLLAAVRDRAKAGENVNAKTYPVKLSETAVALIDEARGEMPRAQWLRVAAIEKLSRDTGIPVEALDGGRRAAPRRRNFADRAKDQQRQEGLEP